MEILPPFDDPKGIFDGRLDLEKIGIFGHSLGGAIAAQFCHNDSRCKVGIDLDGAPYGSVIKDGIAKPFMFLLSDHDNSSDIESHKIMLNVQRIYNSIPKNQRIIATINGSNHFNFSDGAITKNHVLLSILHTIGFLKMKGSTQLIITSYCIHTFFDKYLIGKKNSDIHLLSKLYPEIRVTH